MPSRRAPIWLAASKRSVSKEYYRYGIAIALALICVSALCVWPHQYPKSDIALGIDLVAMAMLGGFVSAHAPQHLVVRCLYAFAFLALAIVGMRLVIQQSREVEKASNEFKATLASVATSTGEVARIQRLNTELQETLLSQSRAITGLARKSINLATGGDGFCTMFLMFISVADDSLVGVASIGNMGEFPLYGVNADVIDLDKQRLAFTNGVTLDNMGTGVTTLNIGDLPPKPSGIMWKERLVLSSGSKESANLVVRFSSSRVQGWAEIIRIRKVGNDWKVAVRVFREEPGRTVPKVLFTQISDGFPLKEGEDIWK